LSPAKAVTTTDMTPTVARRPTPGVQKPRPRRGGSQIRCHATASLAAFTGRALTIFLAGFALKVVGSLVKGLMP
jgi:hypothetical protein